ncbi:hypothetical protein EYF80_001790 [Liparis tanakae]|uniref:Uncharacterized protein n=1 Tax=Liparis tanakae TaxID=230148 RepID=A0A4Z2JC96_9TELE|nr:hypothetical protein EYF80_001790 [Liparis tanakae]
MMWLSPQSLERRGKQRRAGISSPGGPFCMGAQGKPWSPGCDKGTGGEINPSRQNYASQRSKNDPLAAQLTRQLKLGIDAGLQDSQKMHRERSMAQSWIKHSQPLKGERAASVVVEESEKVITITEGAFRRLTLKGHPPRLHVLLQVRQDVRHSHLLRNKNYHLHDQQQDPA